MSRILHVVRNVYPCFWGFKNLHFCKVLGGSYMPIDAYSVVMYCITSGMIPSSSNWVTKLMLKNIHLKNPLALVDAWQ